MLTGETAGAEADADGEKEAEAEPEKDAEGMADGNSEPEGKADDETVPEAPGQNFLKNVVPSTTPLKLIDVDANVSIFLVVPFLKVTTVEDPWYVAEY